MKKKSLLYNIYCYCCLMTPSLPASPSLSSPFLSSFFVFTLLTQFFFYSVDCVFVVIAVKTSQKEFFSFDRSKIERERRLEVREIIIRQRKVERGSSNKKKIEKVQTNSKKKNRKRSSTESIHNTNLLKLEEFRSIFEQRKVD